MALLFGTSARRVALRSSPLENWSSLTSSLPSTSSAQLQRLPALAPAATPSTSRSIHKVSVRKTKQPVSKQQRRASAKKKAVNLEKKALRGQLARETQPDPVLGYRPGNTRERGVNDEGLWQNCELKKIILSKRDVWGLSNDNRGNLVNESSEASRGTAEERAEQEEHGGPLRLNFGFSKEDRELLFKDLPEVTAEDRIKMHLNERMGGAGAAAFNPTADEPAMAQLSRDFEEMQQQEMKSSDMLSRVLDLRNASAKGIDVENKRRIVEHFGGGKDTGSVETQGKCWTSMGQKRLWCCILTVSLPCAPQTSSRQSQF